MRGRDYLTKPRTYCSFRLEFASAGRELFARSIARANISHTNRFVSSSVPSGCPCIAAIEAAMLSANSRVMFAMSLASIASIKHSDTI